MGLDPTQFVAKLERDITSGDVEIGGFPESCLQLLRELKDDSASSQKLVAIVNGDPPLAERVLGMANSAAYQSSTGPTADVGGAIARIGLASFRTVVLAYALAGLRSQKMYAPVQGRMKELWTRSVALSVIARALSVHVEGRRVDRDAMMLGGMLSCLGKIYLLAEATAHEKVLDDFAAVEHLLQTWHVKLTRAILKNMDFPESIIRAATTYESARQPTSNDAVNDLLYVASMFVDAKGEWEELLRRLPLAAPAMRLGLTQVDPTIILSAAELELASFRGALA